MINNGSDLAFPATAEKVGKGDARNRSNENGSFDSDSQSSHLRETLNFWFQRRLADVHVRTGRDSGGVRTRCCSSRMNFSEYRRDQSAGMVGNFTTRQAR